MLTWECIPQEKLTGTSKEIIDEMTTELHNYLDKHQYDYVTYEVPEVLYFLFYKNKIIVGFARIEPEITSGCSSNWLLPNGYTNWHIEHLFVKEPYRGKCYGRFMIEIITLCAKQSDIQMLSIGADWKNKWARNLYEKTGFRYFLATKKYDRDIRNRAAGETKLTALCNETLEEYKTIFELHESISNIKQMYELQSPTIITQLTNPNLKIGGLLMQFKGLNHLLFTKPEHPTTKIREKFCGAIVRDLELDNLQWIEMGIDYTTYDACNLIIEPNGVLLTKSITKIKPLMSQWERENLI